ncbi:MAG TPA: hypothetical protein DCL54_15310, partial [Alphaproteobacteria bacterium]|nr:hypothetical protein [Alphaproteobacteria bacterium]
NAMIADHRKAGGTRAYYESAQPVFYFGAIYFGMVILMYGAWRVEGPVRPWHAWQLIALGLLIQATALALGASLRGGTGGTGRSYDVVRANILSLYIFMSVVLYPAGLTLAALIAPYLGKRPFAGFVLITLIIVVRFTMVALRRPASWRFLFEGVILGALWMFFSWLTYHGIPLSQALSWRP